MIIMKTATLRDKTKQQLDELLQKNTKKLLKLRIQKSTSQLNTSHLFKKYRRENARILTIKKEMEVKV